MRLNVGKCFAQKSHLKCKITATPDNIKRFKVYLTKKALFCGYQLRNNSSPNLQPKPSKCPFFWAKNIPIENSRVAKP